MIEFSDERAFHLTLNPNLIESCMGGLLLCKGLLIEDFHGVNVISYSALHLVNEGARSLTQGLASDYLIVTQN